MDDIYIDKVINGDHNAFQYLVSSYKDFAYSLSFSILKNHHQSEDAVQESFIKAFKALKKFKRQASFKTWLGKIVINESLDQLKKHKRTMSEDDETVLETGLDNITDTLNLIKQDQQKFYISVVFEKLPPEEALALELFYLKEFSLKELIKTTGWSESKSKMVLHRGRNRFYAKLKRILKSEIKELV